MKNIETGLVVTVIGVVLLFIGDKIANVGATIDNIIASKWTAITLLVVGILMMFAPSFVKRII